MSVDVELRIRLADEASAALRRAEQAARREMEAIRRASERARRDEQRGRDESRRGMGRQRTETERLATARITLGMRSEHAIRREIQRTEAAYNRLTRSGTLSMQQQAIAAERTRRRVEQLTNEMGRLTAEQQRAARAAANLERGQRMLRGGAAVVAGTVAAAYTLREPMRNAMNYDEEIGLLANTAFAERDKAGRKIGEASIRAAINKAIGSGMRRDDALAALNKLVADGMVGGVSGALEILPYIGKVSTGSGSRGEDVAAMMGGFINSGYAKNVDEAKKLMGISSAAATAGAFEKNDMARYLPALLPLAKSVGLSGKDGFERLLVLLQQARTTAGSSDEAATNVRNLLTKLTSDETARNFKDAGRDDLYRHLMTQRAQGVDPLTAWQNVIDEEIARNPNLQPAIAKIQNARSASEQDDAIAALNSMAEGQTITQFFRDMQARGALFGMRNRTVEDNVRQAISQSDSIIDVDYESMADRAGFKARVSKERREMAQIEAADQLSPALGKAAELAGDLAERFPLLYGAASLSGTALTALAGAAGLATLAMGGRLPGVGGLGRVAGAVANAARNPVAAWQAARAASPALGTVAAGGAGSLLAAGSQVAAAGAAGYAAGTYIANPIINWGVQKLSGDDDATLGTWIYDLFHKDEFADLNKPVEQPPVEVKADIKLTLPNGMAVQSQTMQASGGNAQINTGSIHGVP